MFYQIENMPEFLQQIREEFTEHDDFININEIIDGCLSELTIGVFGEYSNRLYSNLLSNELIYKNKCSVSFEDWLSLLTKTELLLLDFKTHSLNVFRKEESLLDSDLSFNGIQGEVIYNPISRIFHINYGSNSTFFTPPVDVYDKHGNINAASYLFSIKQALKRLKIA